jgi:hypothetical protein
MGWTICYQGLERVHANGVVDFLDNWDTVSASGDCSLKYGEQLADEIHGIGLLGVLK